MHEEEDKGLDKVLESSAQSEAYLARARTLTMSDQDREEELNRAAEKLERARVDLAKAEEAEERARHDEQRARSKIDEAIHDIEEAEHRHPKEYEYTVDGTEYKSADSTVTGEQIKSRIANLNPAYQLVEESRGNDPDKVIADTDTVRLDVEPHAAFYLVPPATFGR